MFSNALSVYFLGYVAPLIVILTMNVPRDVAMPKNLSPGAKASQVFGQLLLVVFERSFVHLHEFVEISSIDVTIPIKINLIEVMLLLRNV